MISKALCLVLLGAVALAAAAPAEDGPRARALRSLAKELSDDASHEIDDDVRQRREVGAQTAPANAHASHSNSHSHSSSHESHEGHAPHNHDHTHTHNHDTQAHHHTGHNHADHDHTGHNHAEGEAAARPARSVNARPGSSDSDSDSNDDGHTHNHRRRRQEDSGEDGEGERDASPEDSAAGEDAIEKAARGVSPDDDSSYEVAEKGTPVRDSDDALHPLAEEDPEVEYRRRRGVSV